VTVELAVSLFEPRFTPALGPFSSRFNGKLSAGLRGRLCPKLVGRPPGKLNGGLSGRLRGELSGKLTAQLPGMLSGRLLVTLIGGFFGRFRAELIGALSGKLPPEVSGGLLGPFSAQLIGTLFALPLVTLRRTITWLNPRLLLLTPQTTFRNAGYAPRAREKHNQGA
jgi:hypothetical protein